MMKVLNVGFVLGCTFALACSSESATNDGSTATDAAFDGGTSQDATATDGGVASSDASSSDASSSDASSSDASSSSTDASAGDAGTPCTLSRCDFESFPSALSGLTDRATTDVVLLDANGDQATDLLWVSQWGFENNDPPGGVDISLKTGTAAYTSHVVEETDTWFYGLAVDLNGDHVDDVVLTRAATTRSQVGLLLADGAGGFTVDTERLPSLPACATSPCVAAPETDMGYVFGRVAALDIDQDGDTDLVVPVALDTGLVNGSPATGKPDVMLVNDGTGHFAVEGGHLPTMTAQQDGTFCVVAGDFTGDGAPDLFQGGGVTSPRLLVNTKVGDHFGVFVDQTEDDGSAVRRIPDIVMRAFKCAAKDMDGDGDLDVVVVNDVGRDDNQNYVATPAYLFTNDGTGHFEATELPSPAGGPYDGREVDVGDIDGDGRLDIAIGSTAESLSHNGHAIQILLQQPDHSFAQVSNFLSLPDNVFGLRLTDVNGDGLLDIVAAVSKYEASSPGSLSNLVLLRTP